jgi:tetratricopeptide (TPR) repeat protein
LAPQSGLILYGWASCLDRLGRLDESNQRFEQAAPLLSEPMAQSCWYRIGRNFLRLEKPAEAEAALLRAGHLPQAVYLRARHLARTGQVSAAVPLLQELEEEMPDVIEVVRLAAACAQAQGQTPQAAEALERLERVHGRMSLNDQHEPMAAISARFGFFRRLEACMQAPDPGTRAECVRKAIAGHPQGYRYLPIAAGLELEAGRPEQALTLLHEVRREGGLSPELLEQTGDVLKQLGRDSAAQTDWLQAAALGETPTVHAKLAEYFRAKGDDAAARMQERLQLEAQGVAAYRQDELESAEALLGDATSSPPAEARAWFYLGEACRAQGKRAAALEAYEHCLRADPDHGRALAARGQLLTAQPQ